MLIRIQLEESDPPLGSACVEEGSPVGFQGWLELLRVLADLLGPTTPSGLRPGRGGEELARRPTKGDG